MGRDITGQDEMIVSAWHTPGKELKVETNLPEVQSMKITSAGSTKKFEFHGKGFLRRVSPVETNVVASVNTRSLKVDAIVWKSFAGQKYGFTMNNDKFTLLAGKH